MTAPAGNDEVIKVVYQAVADYSQLMRETRRARAETKALKADLDGLSGSSNHQVKVTADTAQAKAELGRILRDILIKVKVTVDAAAANRELQRILRDTVVKIRVTVDALAANRELQRLLRDTVVKVKVTVDALAANRELQRILRDIRVRIRLAVDAASAQAELNRLGRDLTIKARLVLDGASYARAIRDRTVKLGIRLDQAGVTEKFRALLAHLESLGPVVIAVEIGEDAIDRLDAAGDRLRRIRDSMGSGGGDPPRGGSGSGDDSDDDSPTRGAQAATKKLSGLQRASALIAALGPLILAVIPLAAGLVGAIGTIGAALLAAGAAAGIFAIAAIGAFKDVATAVEQYEKFGQVAEGPLGAVVAGVEAVKARYKELQAATQDDVFAVFNRGLNIAVIVLDKIQDLIGEVAAGIDAGMADIESSLSGAGFDEFLDFVGEEGPHAIKQFISGFVDIAAGFGKLLMAFQPFLRSFVDGFAEMAAKFNDWASNLGNDQEFQAFLNYCMENVPRLVDFFLAFVDAAANLLVALAPLGDAFLAITTAALQLIGALPPGVLTTIAAAILGVATAITAVTLATRAKALWTGFTAFLDGLPGRLGRSATAASGLRVALAGVGAALAIGAAVLILTNLMGKLADQQREAADAAKAHADQVANLGKTLAENGGKLDTKENRAAQYEKLTGLTAEGKAGGLFGFGEEKQTLTFSDVAKNAGINSRDLVSGSLGIDPQKQSKNIAKLEDYRRLLLGKAVMSPSGHDAELEAQADAVGKLIDQYEANSLAAGEAADAADEYTDATTTAGGASTDAADAAAKQADANKSAAHAALDAAGAFTTQAAATAAVTKALRADFSGGEVMGRYNAATDALTAYDAAQKASADATDAAAAADLRYKRAIEATTEARKAAVQRIRDVQRALRDLTLDERQATLSSKQAQKRLDDLIANGGTDDEIEQARLDAERARNALEDLKQDKGGKKSDLEDELARGVEGNKALQDAIIAQRDAKKALGAANTAATEAAQKVTETQLAFQTAAGAMGLTADKLRDLKKRMDALKSKTVDLVLNTKDADDKLAALLRGQYALQFMAEGMSADAALAAAAKKVPSLGAIATTDPKTTPKIPYQASPVSGYAPGLAEGGPAVVATGVTQGPVWGPGTGTSDSIATRLPVGGPARLSLGEHIITDAEVRSAPGGHAYMEAFRAGLRAGRPWAPPTGRATGGPALRARAGWSAVLPAFTAPLGAGTVAALPGYARGGAATATRTVDARVDRSVIVNATITNAVPEPASTSLFRVVRNAVEGEEI